MSGIFLVLVLAIVLAGAFLGVFILAARRGQFDDLDDPPRRMLRE